MQAKDTSSFVSNEEFSALLKHCVHCGLCLEACPTYHLFRTEMDSPRGRITLMRAFDNGLILDEELGGSFKEHLSLCLGCLACETACPSEVQYGKLVEMATHSINDVSQPGIMGRWIRWLGFEFFMPNIQRLKVLARALWAYQSSGLQTILRSLGILPGYLKTWEKLVPRIRLEHLDTPQIAKSEGTRLGTVAFFHGCIQEAFLTRINAATIRVLQANGFEVHTPANQTCCGAAQLHGGNPDLVRRLAKQNIDAFQKDDYDAIINNAGGCGYTLKDYARLLSDDPEYSQKAATFAEKVVDFSAFLAENLHHKPSGKINHTVAYLDSCHLRHGQRVTDQPRELLSMIPEIELIELHDPDLCCGSAGTYNLTFPEISNALLQEKIESIRKAGASIVATSNTGCHLHLLAGIRAALPTVQVMHLAEILELSYREEALERTPEVTTRTAFRPQKEDGKHWLAWQERRRRSLTTDLATKLLKDQLQKGQLIHDPVELLAYEQDASIERGVPSAIVFPYSTHDVQKILAWSNENKKPVLGRGSGTSLTGSAVAEKGDVILHFSHMRSISSLDQTGRTITVQPGAIIETIAELVSAHNYYYPPDPASGRTASIGGTISTNAGGPHCFKYGVTSNYIQSLELVLASGEKIRVGGAAFDYPELDLTGLMTGNEGTLAIITEATLRLIPDPPAYRTMMTFFKTIEQAGDAISAIIAKGFMPTTIEMLNQVFIKSIEDYTHIGLSTDAGAMIIIEVDGYPESVAPQIEQICLEMEKHGAYDTHIAQNEEEREKIWYGRKSAHGSTATIAPYGYEVDGTIPRSKLAECIRGMNEISADFDLPYGFLSHAGDGNLHPSFFIQDPEDLEFMDRVYEAGRQLSELFVQLGGTITGEHGVGIEKRDYMSMMYSFDELKIMREIKDVFDPHDLLNPGKIFPSELATVTPKSTDNEIHDLPETPRTTEETADLIRSWYAESSTIGVCGGGTKSLIQTLPERNLETHQLRGILNLMPEELSVTVKAGTTLKEVNAQLASEGMKIPLCSPWAEATIGGIISTNFNAPSRLRHRSIRDLVQALKVVLPDGRIFRAGRPLMKDAAGYDMKKLFVGAHGTLGVITEASIKLSPIPHATKILAIPVENLERGVKLGNQLLQTALNASSILLFHGIENQHWNATNLLLYTLEGSSEDIDAETNAVEARIEEMGFEEPFIVGVSGTDLWADWMMANSADHILYRFGIPPKEINHLLTHPFRPTLDRLEFIYDLPHGLIYSKGSTETSLLRDEVSRLNGYFMMINSSSVAFSLEERWGYRPEGLEVMRSIKTKWDPKNIFNRDAFIL